MPASGTGRVIRAARGSQLNCRSWPQEAAWRMLHNNLDPDVAERPDELVVYGGTGKAARDWPSFDAIVRTLQDLDDDETLLVQSGPAGRRAADPRVGAAGADRQLQPGRRVGQLGRVPPAGAARPDHVRADDRRLVDLHRHPGHPPGHLRDASPRSPPSASAARWPAPSPSPPGVGGMGGAQPLAVTMNGGVVICADVDPARLQRRLETRYLDVVAD